MENANINQIMLKLPEPDVFQTAVSAAIERVTEWAAVEGFPGLKEGFQTYLDGCNKTQKPDDLGELTEVFTKLTLAMEILRIFLGGMSAEPLKEEVDGPRLGENIGITFDKKSVVEEATEFDKEIARVREEQKIDDSNEEAQVQIDENGNAVLVVQPYMHAFFQEDKNKPHRVKNPNSKGVDGQPIQPVYYDIEYRGLFGTINIIAQIGWFVCQLLFHIVVVIHCRVTRPLIGSNKSKDLPKYTKDFFREALGVVIVMCIILAALVVVIQRSQVGQTAPAGLIMGMGMPGIAAIATSLSPTAVVTRHGLIGLAGALTRLP